MATMGIGFRWLDLLEKEFDKACVELDASLSELDPDEPEVVFAARQKIATLSSCFAQLTHKALTIFQNSAKLEAELVDMRAELIQARTVTSGGGTGAGEAAGPGAEGQRARAEAAQLMRENAALRETVLALHSDLFGARLATKYLDKELAGRIQQLQLLGRDMRAELRDSLWAQVEAEILLQRHKTLVRVCRGLAPCPPRPRSPPRSPRRSPPRSPRTRPRSVRVRRSPHLGLGISITGGREHGVPILISELEAGGPAALTGELFVGDAILAINDLDLTQACHKEAVQALQSVKGDCALCVQFIATDDDDHLSDDNYRFPLYPSEGEEGDGGSGATPTAPRTPPPLTPKSDAKSVSDCESPRYAEVYRPPVSYPDYNSLNNNLAILDMDDDSIKIEAQLEPLKVDSPILGRDKPRQRQRGQYRGLPTELSSSNESPHSTPVHGRRPSLKKKRVKPVDWRSKGTYRPVEHDANSSDEAPLSPEPVNGHGISTVFDKPNTTPTPIDEQTPVKSQESISDLSPPELELQKPTVPLPPPKEVIIPSLMKSKISIPNKLNGVDNKPFRIGSAKRVLDAVPIATNGKLHLEKIKNTAHLVTGDGDPDFGTPV